MKGATVLVVFARLSFFIFAARTAPRLSRRRRLTARKNGDTTGFGGNRRLVVRFVFDTSVQRSVAIFVTSKIKNTSNIYERAASLPDLQYKSKTFAGRRFVSNFVFVSFHYSRQNS